MMNDKHELRETMTNDLSVVTAQLVAASCRARDGDIEAAREHIAQAVALLHWKTSFGPSVTRGLSKVCDAAVDGCFDEGHGRVPQREETAPASHRSLSRREAGVLQMMAQGMSNKCIARSLGIAPETVKTHAKGILSKLEARTRAQAVARAEAIGVL
jgi:DNA-binding NarL/FixJ family response regulator